MRDREAIGELLSSDFLRIARAAVLAAVALGSSLALPAEVLVSVEVVVARATAALESPEDEARRKALEVLAHHAEHASAALPRIVQALEDPSGEVRRTAALALEAYGQRAATAQASLERALRDPWPPVRGAAAFALGSVARPGEELRDLLSEVMAAPQIEARVGAASALVRLFPESTASVPEELAEAARALLEESLHDGGDLVLSSRARALVLVSPAGAAAAVPSLVAWARGRGGEANRARLVLSHIGANLDPFPPELVADLKAPHPELRARAVLTLRFLRRPSPENLDRLVEAVDDPSREVALLAAEALGSFGPDAEGVVPNLLERFRSRTGELREAIAFAVADISAEAAQELVEELRASDPELALRIKRRSLLSRL